MSRRQEGEISICLQKTWPTPGGSIKSLLNQIWFKSGRGGQKISTEKDHPLGKPQGRKPNQGMMSVPGRIPEGGNMSDPGEKSDMKYVVRVMETEVFIPTQKI